MATQSIELLVDKGVMIPQRIIDQPWLYELLLVNTGILTFLTIKKKKGLTEVEYIFPRGIFNE